MSDYRNVKIEWLVRMFEQGYEAILDADKQELLDVAIEN